MVNFSCRRLRATLLCTICLDRYNTHTYHLVQHRSIGHDVRGHTNEKCEPDARERVFPVRLISHARLMRCPVDVL